jgi:hypothetical protein
VETLKAKLNEWIQIVHNARSSYYFLNFFSMVEIIYLLNFLDSQLSGSGRNTLFNLFSINLLLIYLFFLFNLFN